MKSTHFTDAVDEYIAARVRLGFALRTEGTQLRDFARYADSINHRGPLTTTLAVSWASLPGKRLRRYPERRLQVLRPFARYLAAIDEANEVPPRDLLGRARHRPVHHIYTESQLLALFRAASQLRPGGLKCSTYAVLFGLLAATGLRISEALKLRCDDVDLKSCVLVVRETKFRKSRLVPFHKTTGTALRRYGTVRDKSFPSVAASSFFVADGGGALSYSTVSNNFLRMRRALHWDGFRPRPRLHDLRHTFVCRRLQAWYSDGNDVNTKIASLATISATRTLPTRTGI